MFVSLRLRHVLSCDIFVFRLRVQISLLTCLLAIRAVKAVYLPTFEDDLTRQ